MLKKIADKDTSKEVSKMVEDMARKQEQKDAMEAGLLDMYFEHSPDQQGMSFDELKAALQSYDIKIGEKELQRMMDRHDEDKAGALDFEEFRKLMIEALVQSSKRIYEVK